MFTIIDVPENAPEDPEWMGTKAKFWFHHPELGRSLFKSARPKTGEDWSEKVASEIASLLGIPHAHYELGTWNTEHGTVSPSILSGEETLIHGNELLVNTVKGYPHEDEADRFRNSRHTLHAVVETLRGSGAGLPPGWEPGPQVTGAVDLFCGYLLFDALIGNTDRHHENWGVVEKRADAATPAIRYLAPSYDHASSLARNETDAVREARLKTRDRGYSVETYASRARSAIYQDPGDRQPLTTTETFVQISRIAPEGAQYWLERLGSFGREEIEDILNQVPRQRISGVAIEFTIRIVLCNQERLLQLRR